MRTLRNITALILFVMAAAVGWGQVAVISGQAINQFGTPLPNAQVRICSVTSTLDPSGNCTPTLPIYLDYGLTMPVGNPYTSDQFGNYTVYVGGLAAPNLYMVQLFPASGITWSYVVNGPGCQLSGCTFAGPITATLFNATQFPYFEINGTQITSAALSDHANIAYLNVANVFTASPQTAPVFNATTQYNVNGTQIACVNLSDCSNLAKLNASNTFSGAVQTAPVFNASTGYRLGGAAPNNHVLLGNGTNYVDSATIPYSIISGAPGSITPFGESPGVPYATSTTTSTLATSAQIVAQLNTEPSTQLSLFLIPVTGSEAEVVTAVTAGTNGDCAQWIATGGIGDAGGPCHSTGVVTDVTGSRVFGTTYQNTGTTAINASGWGTITGGSGDSTITCSIGPSTASLAVWASSTSGTISGEMVGFICPTIPVNYFYKVVVTNIISGTPGKWVESF